MADIACDYLSEIKKVQPRGPYYLGGMCAFGGTIAFEMAQQLVQRGEKVALLVIFDGRPPRSIAAADGTLARRFPGLVFYRNRIVSYIREKRLTAAISGQVSKRLDFRVRDVPRERDGTTPRFRKTVKRPYKRYFAKRYPGQVILFLNSKRAAHDTTPRLLSEWGQLAGGGLDYHVIPDCNHKTMFTEPHVLVLAGKLRNAIDGALGGRGRCPLPILTR